MERKSYRVRLSSWWLLLAAIYVTIPTLLLPGLNLGNCYAFGDLEKHTNRLIYSDPGDTKSSGQSRGLRAFDLQDLRLIRAKWISPLEKYTKFDEKLELSGGGPPPV